MGGFARRGKREARLVAQDGPGLRTRARGGGATRSLFGRALVHPVFGPGLCLGPVSEVLLAAPVIVARIRAPWLGGPVEIPAPGLVVVRPIVRSPRMCHTSLRVGRAVRPNNPSRKACARRGACGTSRPVL